MNWADWLAQGPRVREPVSRERIPNPDGEPGMERAAEMIPPSGKPLELAFEEVSGRPRRARQDGRKPLIFLTYRLTPRGRRGILYLEKCIF